MKEIYIPTRADQQMYVLLELGSDHARDFRVRIRDLVGAGVHLHDGRHRHCALLQEVPRSARRRVPLPLRLLVRLRLSAQ